MATKTRKAAPKKVLKKAVMKKMVGGAVASWVGDEPKPMSTLAPMPKKIGSS